MKLMHHLGLALVALALIAPVTAHAEIKEGWYVGMNTNMSFQKKGDAEVSGVTNLIEYKDGWGISGYSGYAWGDGLRTEGELTYRHSTADTITGTNAGIAAGGIHNLAVMANVLYDYETGTRITPYVGAGIGASLVGTDHMRTINGASFDDNRLAFAYQGIVGFSLALEGNWSFNADYRYFATPDIKSDSNVGSKGEVENASHNLMMGIRYDFAKPPAPAPAPVIAKPAPRPILKTRPIPRPMVPKARPPIVAAVPQSYMVFFDFDKSKITPEASRVISSAAAEFKRQGFVRLIVSGHTDTMGSLQYNQALSQRRATAVQKEFIKLGIPSQSIVMNALGEGNLRIPTNDQVREVQNRRAEIMFQ